MIQFSGIDYLKIDIANNFGLDKLDWQPRIDWVNQNEKNLETLIKQAETPALYFAGVQALRKAQVGEPSGYPISLDATASVLQIFSLLTGCVESARLCNVVSTGHREDPYTSIYKAMLDQVGDTAKVSRLDCKEAIMTSFYNSTSIPKQVFGGGELLRVFYNTMETKAPGAWELSNAFLDMWDSNAMSNDWVMPDNFHVHVKVMGKAKEYVQFDNAPYEVTYEVNAPQRLGRSLGANSAHSIDGMIVREVTRRCCFDPQVIDELKYGKWGTGVKEDRPKDKIVKALWRNYQYSGFLSTRIIPLLDRDNMGFVQMKPVMDLVKSMPKVPFDLLSIHDGFRCLPNHGNDLRQQYVEVLAQIAKSNLLSFMVSQIKRRVTPVNKKGDLSSLVLQSEYALS